MSKKHTKKTLKFVKKTGIILMFFCLYFYSIFSDLNAYYFGEPTEIEEKVTQGFDIRCKDIKETDYPTIFIPGIAASWYSEYGYGESKVKRWIPDPITHVYDTLFYTFKSNGYALRDVFYTNEFTIAIDENKDPKQSLYLFGYDWKKDNKITSTLVTQLIGKIREVYYKKYGCDIGKVNIVAHSMGGLVARSVIQNNCLKFLYDGKKYTFSVFPIKSNNGIINDFGDFKDVCTNPYSNQYISEDTKIHKLITIGTPHRGSPKSLLAWEKGDIDMTDGGAFEEIMKLQLLGWFKTDMLLYRAIHGYDEKVPNGIVGLGQLLPDVDKENDSNKKLRYLFSAHLNKDLDTTISHINDIKISNPYPKNTFLETLNTKENIEKGFENVDAFISYYSTIVGNNGTNNIIQLGAVKEYTTANIHHKDVKVITHDDITLEYIGKNIYDAYPSEPNDTVYSIIPETIVRNETGLGGDGTVPTNNLKLIPNDSIDGKEISHPKFESRLVQCHNPNKPLYSKDSEAWLYRRFGEKDKYRLCAHTNIPTAVAIKVFDDIAGTKKKYQERTLLLTYLGYASYLVNYETLESDYIHYLPILKPFSDGKVELYRGIGNLDSVEKYFGNDTYNKRLTIQQVANDAYDRSEIPVDAVGYIDNLSSIIRYDILSPINILITDSEGRRIGIDPDTGRIINEIPGAWTSGDTEGSNEPEFFIIPQTGTGKVKHTIETFATGQGEYHIEARKIDLGDESQESSDESQEGGITELFTIAGNAQEGFGEEYKITSTQQSDYSYAQTSDYPPIITTGKDTYTTLEESIVLRYSIKGKNQGVELIKYTLKDAEGKSIQEVTQDITGKLDITLPQVGDYTLDLELLDIKKKQIENTKTTTLKLTRTTDWREEDQVYQDKSESAKTGEDYETLIQEYGKRRKKGVVIDLWSWFGD